MLMLEVFISGVFMPKVLILDKFISGVFILGLLIKVILVLSSS